MTVIIHTTTLGFSIGVTQKGIIKDTGLFVMDYAERFVHRTFDRQQYKWVIVQEFFHFDREQQICYFPKYDLEEFKSFLTRNHTPYSLNEQPPAQGVRSDFLMLPHITYKNDKQKNCIEFITNEKIGPQRAIALQTGSGKTISYIWGLQKLGIRSITTMTSRLEQWVKEFGIYTTVEPDDIYIVQGVASLTKLFNQIDKSIHPKSILWSTKTMRLYLEYGPGYQHLPHPSEACEKLGVGIVGTDEYHEHFYTNFLIDIMLNPALFIPITATFLAPDPFVKKIFDQLVPKEIQFTGGDYDKFVSVYAYNYTSGGHLLKPFHYMSPRGYSQQIFEKHLLNRGRKVLDPFVYDALVPIIREHYVNIADPGEKFLLLCASTKMCDHLVNIIQREFNSKTVTAFYSGIPESVLKEYDMIVSTPGSCGTGRDVKGLRTCLVIVSVDSDIHNYQFIGRLRGPPQMMNEPRYVYISFAGIPSHVRVHQKRSALLGPKAKSFTHRTIS